MRPQAIGTSRFPDEIGSTKASVGKGPFESSFAALFQYVAEGVQAAPPKSPHAERQSEQDAAQGMPADTVKPELPSPQPTAVSVPEASNSAKAPIEAIELQRGSSVAQDAEGPISVSAVEPEIADSAKQNIEPRIHSEPLKERDIELQVAKPAEKQAGASMVASKADHHASQISVHHHLAASQDQRMQDAPAAVSQTTPLASFVPIAQSQIVSAGVDTKLISVNTNTEIAATAMSVPRKAVSQQATTPRQIPQAQAVPSEEIKTAPAVVEEKGSDPASAAHVPMASSSAASAVPHASIAETTPNLAVFQGAHAVEAKSMPQTTVSIVQPHAASSYASPSTNKDLPHVELASSDRSLEVGVVHETHGWLRIRVELTGSGEVSASLTGSSASVERLRSDLPALNSYLHEERVPLADLSVHAAPMLAAGNDALHTASATQMANSLSNGTGGQTHSNAQDKQQRQVIQPTAAQSSKEESRDAIFAARGAADLHEEHRALGWISVRA